MVRDFARQDFKKNLRKYMKEHPGMWAVYEGPFSKVRFQPTPPEPSGRIGDSMQTYYVPESESDLRERVANESKLIDGLYSPISRKK